MTIQLNRYPSPLRYPGGKGKIGNYLKLVLLENGLVGTDYVEPYAGGASVALSLLYEEFISHAYINDIDPSVFTFWKVVLEDTDALCERIRRATVTMREWERQRRVQTEGLGTKWGEVDLAFSTFFLNRTNRSGIISGGPIGGHDQSGTWKLDARYNGPELIRRIQKVSRFRSRITVSGQDAKQFLLPWASGDRSALVYLDPPYFGKGSDLYTNTYSAADHADIAEVVCKLPSPWIVSYDDVPAIRELYQPYLSVCYTLSYSAAARYRGSEVMFLSPGLKVPKGHSPANLPEGIVRETKMAVASLKGGA